MIKKHVFALSLALITAGAVFLGTANYAEAAQRKTTKCWLGCTTSHTKPVTHHVKKTSTKKSVQAKKTSTKKGLYAKKTTKKSVAASKSRYKTAKRKTAHPAPSKVAVINPRVHHSSNALNVADDYVGLSERGNRKQLMGLFSFAFNHKIDPARTPWCAAFANSVLRKSGKKGTGSLAAASFRTWGKSTRNPKAGDIVVMRGHVGFYMGTVNRNGVRYVAVLGGNQSNKVKVTYYRASKVVAYRTAA